jgi:hypothetical protein
MSELNLRDGLLKEGTAHASGPENGEKWRREIGNAAARARVRSDRAYWLMVAAWTAFIVLMLVTGLLQPDSGPQRTDPSGTFNAPLIYGFLLLRVTCVLGAVSTLSFMVRSRGASLAEMNHRLARLEELVESMVREKDR